MSETFIYALCEPDTNKIRYVGKSNNPQERLKRHVGMYEPNQTHKQNWVRSVLEQGKSPSLLVLEKVDTTEWEGREIWWIEKCKKEGIQLTNIAKGGFGGGTLSKSTLSACEIERRKESGRIRMTAIWDKIRAGMRSK
jgi:hypothetical protein